MSEIISHSSSLPDHESLLLLSSPSLKTTMSAFACSEEPVSEVSDWGLELAPLPPSFQSRSPVKSMALALLTTLEVDVHGLLRSTPAIAELISEVTDGQGEGTGEFSTNGGESKHAGPFPGCARKASLWSLT